MGPYTICTEHSVPPALRAPWGSNTSQAGPTKEITSPAVSLNNNIAGFAPLGGSPLLGMGRTCFSGTCPRRAGCSQPRARAPLPVTGCSDLGQARRVTSLPRTPQRAAPGSSGSGAFRAHGRSPSKPVPVTPGLGTAGASPPTRCSRGSSPDVRGRGGGLSSASPCPQLPCGNG